MTTRRNRACKNCVYLIDAWGRQSCMKRSIYVNQVRACDMKYVSRHALHEEALKELTKKRTDEQSA